jgi:hypothetical protein
VEALLAVNQELLKNLEQRYKNWSQRQTIGDVFLQMVCTLIPSPMSRSCATIVTRTRARTLTRRARPQSPHLKGYSEYCRNYDYAVSYLDRLQASTPALAHFVQAPLYPSSLLDFSAVGSDWCACDARGLCGLQICSSFPEAKGLSLSSYLIMPVQRIPRYTLLIQVQCAIAAHARTHARTHTPHAL